MGAIGVAVLVISDTAAKDSSLDSSGPSIERVLLEGASSPFEILQKRIVPDEVEAITNIIHSWTSDATIQFIVTSGGTGFGPRDRTPEAVAPLIERHAPGLIHLMMKSSLDHTPLAALSRPVAGTIGNTLIVTLPGSPKAVNECLAALVQGGVLLHAIDLIGGGGKDVHSRLGLPDRGAAVSSTKVVQGHHHGHSHLHPHAHSHQHHAPTPKSHDPSLGAPARHRHSPYPMIELKDAMKIVESYCKPLGTLIMAVNSSLRGFVLAEDVHAPTQFPLQPSTNVDGYAVKSSYGPGIYQVLTPQSFDLSTGVPIPDGSIYRINTGSPLPNGTDAVIMVEDTELITTTKQEIAVSHLSLSHRTEHEEEETVKMLVRVDPGENVRQPGSDVKKGSLVLEKGIVIQSVGGEIGTITFVGQKQVTVYRKPVVAIMSTGNEIVDLHGAVDLSAGDEVGKDGWKGVFDTNRPSLQAVLEGFGYPVVDLGIVTDDLESHLSAMKRGLQEADLLLTTGGSSMGSSDLLKPVIEIYLNGTVHFGRVNIKPGKPTTFATVDSKPIFALPGNPVSALVMFHIFVLPALRMLGGWPAEQSSLPRVPAKILDDMYVDTRPEFHRVHVRASGSGLIASSTGGQRSSRIASLARANGLAALPGRAKEDKIDRLQSGTMIDVVMIGEMGTAE